METGAAGGQRGRRPPPAFGEDIEIDFPAPPPPPSQQRGERPRTPQRTAPRSPRRGSETAARVLWALPWIVFAIAIVAAGGIAFTLAMIALATLGLAELFRMTAAYRPLGGIAILAAAALALAAHYGTPYQLVLVGVCLFPAMFAGAAARPNREGITLSMAVTTFGVAWIGIPFAHAVMLRDLPLHGGALVIDVLVGTFLTDTAAYAGGRLFGRRPLAPRLSPNKTFEGLLSGLAGGTFGFWFAGLYQNWLSGADALIMGLCVAALAPVGDLFSSLVKRDLRIKDTGKIFGPHGGLLDRLDAVLFTIVAGYYLAVWLVY
jgi:phosphatidate cytidylyltransferase